MENREREIADTIRAYCPHSNDWEIGQAAHAIAALEPVTPAQAARVLLDLLDSRTEHSGLATKDLTPLWLQTYQGSGFVAVRGFLRALAEQEEQGNDTTP